MGEVLWDLFNTGPCFGGAAANFACHAAAQGARATIVSAVGQDACETAAFVCSHPGAIRTEHQTV